MKGSHAADSRKQPPVFHGLRAEVPSPHALLILGGIAFSVAMLAVFPDFTIDDAYIYFRYAANLANHGELNWNVGQDPVEGFTGIALPVLLAVGQVAGVTPIVASKAIGIAAFFLGGVFLLALSTALGLTRWVRSALFLLYMTAPFLYTHAISGLETMLFTASILASLLALYRWLRSKSNRSAVVLMLVLLITALVRPEGAALAGYSIVGVVWIATTRLEKPSSIYAIVLACFVVPGTAYFLWRWQYYGRLLPNPFYAKQSTFRLDSIESLEAFLTLTLAVPAILAVVTLAINTDRVWRSLADMSHERRIPLAVLGAVSLAFVGTLCALYIRTYLVMNYSYRFFVPLFPVLLLMVGFAIDRGWHTVSHTRREHPLRHRFVVGVTAVILLVQGLVYARRYPDEFRFTSTYGQMLRDEHVQIGLWLKEHMPASEWLAVVSDAGASPYYSQLPTVDFAGLNDEVVGSFSERERVDYFFSRNPGAAVLSSYSPVGFSGNPEADRIVSDPRFDRYRLVRRYGSEARDFFQVLYVREDLFQGIGSSGHEDENGVTRIDCEPDASLDGEKAVREVMDSGCPSAGASGALGAMEGIYDPFGGPGNDVVSGGFAAVDDYRVHAYWVKP